MSKNIEISLLDSLTSLTEIEEIFFMTSSVRSFSSEKSRESFKYKYLGFYLEKFRDFVVIAKEKEKEKVLGYCLGAPVTDERFYSYQPHLEIFKDLYIKYPAHLHINLHPDAQGLGIGQKLFTYWESLACQKAQGIHIMTSPDARNVSFYRRLGLKDDVVRKYRENDILLMGKCF